MRKTIVSCDSCKKELKEGEEYNITITMDDCYKPKRIIHPLRQTSYGAFSAQFCVDCLKSLGLIEEENKDVKTDPPSIEEVIKQFIISTVEES